MSEHEDTSEPSSGPHATDPFVERVYTQLRELAQAKMRRETPGHTLRATDLVHEAYLRLKESGTGKWDNRAHFLAAAAEAMRRILIERARAKGREKRGGDSDGKPAQRISFADVPVADLSIEYDPVELLSVEAAIGRLEQNDPRAAQVVRLRFYGGLSIEETAEALNVAERTVKRDWTFAKAWLVTEIGGTGSAA